jgi:hypothetical protein
MKKRSNPGRLFAVAVFVAISVLALHINYEWGLVGMNVIYALGFSSALVGRALAATKLAKLNRTGIAGGPNLSYS